MYSLYLLSENVGLRKEKKGGVLLLRNKEDNSLFFYIPDDFGIFLEMKEGGRCLGVDLCKFKDAGRIILFLSYMIKNGILVHKKDCSKKSGCGAKFVELKSAPKMISLFITPTVHFRRYYGYGN
ncbi:MAG: hypothetical protein WC926_00360 [Candidatus Paceibacterota bacterium]|jgi:hypothetical protein